MSTADEARLAEIAAELTARVEAVFGDWIASLVRERAERWQADGGDLSSEQISRAAHAAARRAADAVLGAVADLLATDVDEQQANPLHLLRQATRWAGDELAGLGVPAPQRDPFAREAFPDDVYDLVPATWSDIDPSLHEPGVRWGAAKAFVFMSRRR